MTNSSEDIYFPLFFIGIVVGIILSLLFYIWAVRPSWRADCVEGGIAKWEVASDGTTTFKFIENKNKNKNKNKLDN